MALLDLPNEILGIIVEQLRTEAFQDNQSIHRLPRLNAVCALALTSRRFTKFASDAIHREVRLVGSRQHTKDEPDDKRRARWRCWTQSCNKYPQMLDRVKILRALWFTSFDHDLVESLYSCLGRAKNLEHLSLTVWTSIQQDSIMARIGVDALSLLNVKILELSFHSRRRITDIALNRICRLPNLRVLVLQSQWFWFEIEQSGAGLGEVDASRAGENASRLEEIVLDCKFIDHRILNFVVETVPKLKQLTIPDKIGIHRDENGNSYARPIPLRPTTIDLILQPLTDTLERLTITSPRNYTPTRHSRIDCERPVGFSKFTALKSLDVPSHFLFDLTVDGENHPRTNYDLFPKTLKSLKIRFEYFFTIHELEQEWGMTPDDWYDAWKRYETTDSIVGTQQCQWIALLLKQDKTALSTLRQVYARDRNFDISHCHILAIDRKISGAFDGVDVSVRVRASETWLAGQILKKDAVE